MADTIKAKTLVKIIADGEKRGKKVCYILGAGASRSSGIPTGAELARQWYNELFVENCFDRDDIEKWKAELGIGAIDKNNLDYSDMYALRYYIEEKDGRNFLASQMLTAIPRAGYYHLAHRMVNQNSIVVTTNFDYLIQQAITIFLHALCRDIHTPNEIEFIDTELEIPQILKIHGDVLFDPKSKKIDLQKLHRKWTSILKKIFADYIVVVIGYNGGDLGFMDVLRNTTFNENLYWCVMDITKISEEVENLVTSKKGKFVIIDDFDELMYQLGQYFDDPDYNVTKEQNNKIFDELIDAKRKVCATVSKDGEVYWAISAYEHVQLGIAHFDNHNYDEAIKNFNEAIELDPNLAVAYSNRGAAYSYIDECELAIADYVKARELNRKGAIVDHLNAIKLNQNNATAYYKHGNNYCDKGEYDLAIADYAKAIELNPNYANVYCDRGFAYTQKDEYDLAIADYTKAIKLNPNYKLYCARGIVYYKKSKYRLAITDCTKAIKLNPNYAGSFCIRGIAYYKKGKYKLVISDFTKAIELEPDLASLYKLRAETYTALNKPDLAAADMAKYRELTGNAATPQSTPHHIEFINFSGDEQSRTLRF
ncbi:MAG: tetratricopeptide repeat protein [Oscillospiraceae bacterium]|jgi:tetratricopeptide (TPR) repeat protein|nr:tetratricopeptide repeat protein [Oscillospiraceae bacterium]